jgi:hypothetical protein
MEPPDTSALAIVEDPTAKTWDGRAIHQTQKSAISTLPPDDKTKGK